MSKVAKVSVNIASAVMAIILIASITVTLEKVHVKEELTEDIINGMDVTVYREPDGSYGATTNLQQAQDFGDISKDVVVLDGHWHIYHIWERSLLNKLILIGYSNFYFEVHNTDTGEIIRL